MLPNSGEGAYSVESTVTSLYRSCREIDSLDKSQSDLLLKRAIKSVGELEGLDPCRDHIIKDNESSGFFLWL